MNSTAQTLHQSGNSRVPGKADVYRVALLIAFSVILYVFVNVFSSEKLQFLYKDVLHLSASDLATVGIVLGVPGYLRPFMGGGSDIFPLFGFHRRTYYALSFLLAGSSYLGLSVLHDYRLWTVIMLVLVAGAGGNLLFVIMDAVMVAVGNATGTVSRLQTVQQFLQPVLGIALAHLRGWVTQHWSYHQCFATSAALAFLGIPLALLIQERRVVGARHADETIEEHRTRLAATREDRARATAALQRALSSPGLWAMVGYVFYLIITPGTGTAQFYYEVDSLHFSKQFIGDLGIPGGIGAMLGILCFAAISPRLPARMMVWGAYLMDCSLYVIYFFFHDRTSGLVVTFIAAFAGSVYNLCLLTLAARATPKAVEGAIYGLVIAAIGLAGALGEKIGASLYDYFGPSHHYTTTHGWHWLLGIGFAFTVVAAVFIPFLPAWARSGVRLGQLKGEEAVA